MIRALLLIAVAASMALAVETTVPVAVKPAGAQPSPTADPGNPPAPPVVVRFDAAGGITYAAQTGAASFASGGVKAWYENVFLHCDRIDFWQAPLAGGKHPLIERALLSPGAGGPGLGKLLLDSRHTALPLLPFRGLLNPDSAELIRVAPADPKAKSLSYKLRLKNLGYFIGEVHTRTDWVPCAGWADHAEFNLIADVVDDALENWRIDAIFLFGLEGQPVQKAKFMRVQEPLRELTEVKTVGKEAQVFHLFSRTLTMEFDAKGRFQRFVTGLDSEIEGVPNFDMPVNRQSRPVLESGH